MSIEAMKQALEALYPISHNSTDDYRGQADKAITSLRQAIAEFDSHTLYREGYVNGYAFGEAAGRKAVAEKQDGACQHCAGKGCVACDAREQEPVGWIDSKNNMLCVKINESCRPLYIHPPQPAKPIPCANNCEATAFEIVIKNLQGEIERLKASQRTWVGLDHHDKKKFSSWLDHKSDDEVFTAIEAKLKELNT